MINLTKKDQDNIFWFFLVPIVVFVTLFISLSPWLLELAATPADRVFSGINRWSTDYFIYLSYVEQGRRGLLPVKLLLTTVPHTALFSHLVYTIPGFIFGHFFGLGSIFIYHLFRALYGMVFLWMTIVFFYLLSKNKTITLTAFFLTFYISGDPRYLSWLQEQNIISRPTSPLHYSAGFIVFLATFLYFFYSKAKPIKKTIIFGILLNLLLLTNPFNYLIIGVSFGVYFIIQVCQFLWNRFKTLEENQASNFKLQNLTSSIKHLASKNQLCIILYSFLLSLPLFFYLNYYLSTKPWGVIGVSPKFYVVTTPPVSFWETALSIGPIFFLGILGMIITMVKKQTLDTRSLRFDEEVRSSKLEKSQTSNIKPQYPASSLQLPSSVFIFLVLWPTIQLFLLLFGNQLKIHPPRAFSGLYYLPLAYFTALLINYLTKNRQRLIIIYSFLFIFTLPNYLLFYKQQLYAFTDFKAFSTFTYPTKNQVEVYKFLEKNTPAGSGALAMFEASNHLMGFSGNSTELGMDHQTKIIFYSNQMTNQQARELLRKNRFQYVYYGPQEQSAGGNPEKYLFLQKIFENQDVKIYKVKK